MTTTAALAWAFTTALAAITVPLLLSFSSRMKQAEADLRHTTNRLTLFRARVYAEMEAARLTTRDVPVARLDVVWAADTADEAAYRSGVRDRRNRPRES